VLTFASGEACRLPNKKRQSLKEALPLFPLLVQLLGGYAVQVSGVKKFAKYSKLCHFHILQLSLVNPLMQLLM